MSEMTEVTNIDDFLPRSFRLETFVKKKRLVNSPPPQPILMIEQNQKFHKRNSKFRAIRNTLHGWLDVLLGRLFAFRVFFPFVICVDFCRLL